MIGMSFPCPRLGGNQGGPTFTGILDQLGTAAVGAWSVSPADGQL